MPLSDSFYKIQSILHPKHSLNEDQIGEVDPATSEEKKSNALSYLCDYVLSSLVDHDALRDAIIDTRPNLSNNSVLCTVNPELETTDELVKFISELPMVSQVAFGEKEDPSTGNNVRVVKIQGDIDDANPETDSSKFSASVGNFVGMSMHNTR